MDIMGMLGDMFDFCTDVFGYEFTIPGVATFTLWDVALCVVLFYCGGRIINTGLALDYHD